MTRRRKTRTRQLSLDLKPPGRGGARPGAGRPAQRGAKVLHRTRERVPGYCPVHVTVKVGKHIPKLRDGKFVHAFRRSLAECCHRPGFRVVHYSIQQNHCHFLIEAHGKKALADGMKSLNARLARDGESSLSPSRSGPPRSLPLPRAATTPRGPPRPRLRALEPPPPRAAAGPTDSRQGELRRLVRRLEGRSAPSATQAV